MMTLRRPSDACVARYLEERRDSALSYGSPGLLSRDAPVGFFRDLHRVPIGSGREAFVRGCGALGSWMEFDLGWIFVSPRCAPLRAGTVVGVLARHLGFWSLNPCRVLEVSGGLEELRYGFSYGTLPGHAEQGEESFQIEHASDGTVWFEIRAVSRPSAWLGRRTWS